MVVGRAWEKELSAEENSRTAEPNAKSFAKSQLRRLAEPRAAHSAELCGLKNRRYGKSWEVDKLDLAWLRIS